MASVKIIRRKKPNKDGTYSLAIQIIKDRRKSISHLGVHVNEEDWNDIKQRVKKSHPNSARLNNFLVHKLAEANDKVLEVETHKKIASARALKETIKPSSGATFFSQAQSFLDALKASGKYNQYTADKPRISHFREFLKGGDIAFTDITVGLLERFVVYLKSIHKPKRGKAKRIGDRTIANHLVVIRSVFAFARKNHVVTKAQSPFGEDGIKIKFPDTTKVGLSEEDVEALENVVLPDPDHDHARNLWLFSFYFAGIRVSDVFRLKWSDFQNGRLHYSMGKNNKGGSLKIPDKAGVILQKYEQFRQNKDDLVFPELKGVNLEDEFVTKRTIAFKTSAVDKVLRLHVAPAAGIEKKLTMHIARHTFGSLAGDAIPIQMLQKLYRHSNVSTTIGYQQNFIHQEADDALDAVINKSIRKPQPS
jgi:integrase/recombinase XerD